MAPQPEVEPISTVEERPAWPLASRVAFRFCFVYLTLFCASNQILLSLLPYVSRFLRGDLAAKAPVRKLVSWAALHVFHVSKELVYQGSGSGDKTFDWVLSFCALCMAAIVTLVWSVLDRRRVEYRAMHKWFYVFLRFALGTQMLLYGLAKVVPMQMPFPQLTRLVEPFGNFSPMGVLWYSIGAAPAYEMFAGSAELFGGILLFVPRTATFGALVCLADTVEVFMLNMAYDIPVKLFAFHLILMSLVLLVPELGRIARFFLSKEAVGPSRREELFRTVRANRIAVAVQVVFGLTLLGINSYETRQQWFQYGGAAPRSALYGIWNIDTASTGTDGFKRVIFDRPAGMTLQRSDDTFTNYGAVLHMDKDAIDLTQGNWKGSWKFDRPAQDKLALDGEINGHAAHMQLTLVDRSKMLLVSRGFHWIQEYPFNR